MTSGSTDVVVVGGGIVGAACTALLAEDGWTVTLLEAGEIGRGTTAAGMGHVVTLDGSEPLLALTRYSVEAWKRFAPHLSSEVAWNPTGTLWLAADDQEEGILDHRARTLRAAGAHLERVESDRLRKLEPNVSPTARGALWVRDDAVLDAHAAASHFARMASERGSTVRERETVVGLSGREVRLKSGTIVRARKVVLAAGPDSASLVPELPVYRRKGHILRLRPPAPLLAHQVIEAGYGAGETFQERLSLAFTSQPLPDGTMLLGASRQNGVEDPAVEPAVLDALVDRAARFFPTIPNLERVGARTGFRPATPDDLPLIGAWPSDPDLVLAVGHEGFGITASVGTAALVRDWLAGRPSPISMAPYNPRRFGLS